MLTDIEIRERERERREMKNRYLVQRRAQKIKKIKG